MVFSAVRFKWSIWSRWAREKKQEKKKEKNKTTTNVLLCFVTPSDAVRSRVKPEQEKSVSTAALSKRKRNGPIAVLGKIQGDGRKFLDLFKSYFGSKMSSQSLNEAHIYQLQPKSATKGFAC